MLVVILIYHSGGAVVMYTSIIGCDVCVCIVSCVVDQWCMYTCRMGWCITCVISVGVHIYPDG